MKLTSLIAGSLLAATPLVAAPQSPSGIFANVPLLLLNAIQEQVHMVGPAAGAAVPASTVNPFFSAQAMFGATGLKVASFSTGKAYVTLDIQDINGEDRATANLSFENGSWSFIIYSLGNENPGQPGAAYENALSSVRGDVFARVLEGSEEYIPGGQVGDIRWARLGADMGVTDVNGIDSFGYAQLLNPPVDLPVEIFFTVDTNQSPNRPSDPRWAGVPTGEYLGSTIFRVGWVAGTGWGPVEVYKLAGVLGIDPTDQIDALTVDTVQNVILLSLENAGLIDQLWIWSDRSTEEEHTGPYYTADGQFLYADKYLLLKEGDEIDGACVDDPKAPEHAIEVDTRHQWRQRVMQLPLINFPQPIPPLDIVDCSGFRVRGPNGTDKYHLHLRNGFTENIIAVLRKKNAALNDPVIGDRIYLAPGGKVVKKITYLRAQDFNGPPVENPIYYWQLWGASMGRVDSWSFQFLR